MALLTVCESCGTSSGHRTELEQVAKDWCETIRASQVIPVYPLTEDLQPGDLFLVQVPIDKQQEMYDDAGYLPLDNHLARLDPQGYGEFYDYSIIGRDKQHRLPADFLRPNGDIQNAWAKAPHAAFPTYSFCVTQKKGLNLAVPLSSASIGLNLLGSHTAHGTVTIQKARTIGIDTFSLYRQLADWASEKENAEFLRVFGPSSGHQNYIRAVTRVYVTGGLDVSLTSTRTSASGLEVKPGAAQEYAGKVAAGVAPALSGAS